ncbi:Lrp/AsnC family transcriptional regulator [Dactylosporangium sp. NPDC051484]|uniref:Lrp/AsnC family transcriptional regulator n=1 Tax=Dactylosporangium sp. NPDC051484 TaxID=3154942 RepID=UPI00344C3B69
MELDTLDLSIVDGLRMDGRVPFSTLAEVLGVSDQTVARRYRRLRVEAGLRVAGLPDGARLGYDRWLIRLQTTPDSAAAIAEALARRPDTTWVTLASGGTEVTCVVQNPGTADRDALLLQKLPRTPRVVSVRAHCLMHQFTGGAEGDTRMTRLTAEQTNRLRPAPAPPDAVPALSDADRPLLAALSRDGRLGYPQLATATGWSESTVRRRLEHLCTTGAVFFDVEVDPSLVGYRARFLLWLSVAPAHLEAVGRAMATHPEVVFAAATTGDTNLVATVICHDMAGLYEYVTHRVGPLPGVDRLESVPSLRHVKQVGALLP